MRKVVVLIVIAFALSGCEIFTVLDRSDLGGSFFEPVDVEKMPDGGYLAVGRGVDTTWGGTGIVVTRPDGEHERFFPGCQGWLGRVTGTRRNDLLLVAGLRHRRPGDDLLHDNRRARPGDR